MTGNGGEDGDPGLSEEAYAAQIKLLGLRSTGTNTGRTTMYETREGELIGVANADWQEPEQRSETIERLKRRLGVGLFPGAGPH